MYNSAKTQALKSELQQRYTIDTTTRTRGALPPHGAGSRFLGSELASPLAVQDSSFSKGFKSTSASSRFSHGSAYSTSNSSGAHQESGGREHASKPAPKIRTNLEAHPTVKLYNKKNIVGALTVVPS